MQPLVAVFGAMVLTACAHSRRPGSYLPVGATAWYGNSTNDGVAVTLRRDSAAAASAVLGAWRATGYSTDRAASGTQGLRTLSRMIGGDTTMQVTAHIFPLELPEPGASVTFTATYDVPSRRIVRTPVIQRPRESNALFGMLQALGDSLRARSVRAP